MRSCVISALHTLAHEVPCPLYQISDETVMKILVGLVGATLMLSSGAFAQHVSGGAHGAGGGMHDVGGGHIPAHGPGPRRRARVFQPAPASRLDTRPHLTCIPTVIDGSATTPAAMIRTITSIIHGSTAIFPAPSVRGMSGDCMAATAVDSSSADSSFQSPPSILPFAITGYGIATTS
jgi:hypothetical protein